VSSASEVKWEDDDVTTVTYSGTDTLPADISVPAGKTLIVTGNLTQTADLEVEGEIAVTGSLGIAEGASIDFGATGTITGAGTIDNQGTIKTGNGATLKTVLEKATGDIEANGEVAVTGSLAIRDDTTLTVAAEAELTVAEGAKVTVADGGTLTIAGKDSDDNVGSIVVEGDITVAGTLVHAADSTANLTGSITVEPTGVYKDLNSGGGSVWGDDSAEDGTGSLTFKEGAKAYVGDETVAMISDAAHTETAPVLIQLTEGGFTLTKTGYSLDGKATLHGIFGLGGTDETITLSATSVLTIAATWAPSGEPSADYPGLWLVMSGTSIVGETVGTDSSKIVIVDGGIYITSGTNNFYDSDGAKITGTGVIIVPAGTYTWDAAAGGEDNEGWKKEADAAAEEPEPEPVPTALSE
jgi:hypothetical protein